MTAEAELMCPPAQPQLGERRLAAERRITYHKVGRYVRFSERDIADYLAAHRVEAMTASTIARRTAPRTTRRAS